MNRFSDYYERAFWFLLPTRMGVANCRIYIGKSEEHPIASPSDEAIKMVWKFLTTVGKSVAEAAKFVSPEIEYIADFSLNIHENCALAKRLDDLKIKQLKLDFLKNKNT